VRGTRVPTNNPVRDQRSTYKVRFRAGGDLIFETSGWKKDLQLLQARQFEGIFGSHPTLNYHFLFSSLKLVSGRHTPHTFLYIFFSYSA
jgi:hypothetical protein